MSNESDNLLGKRSRSDISIGDTPIADTPIDSNTTNGNTTNGNSRQKIEEEKDVDHVRYVTSRIDLMIPPQTMEVFEEGDKAVGYLEKKEFENNEIGIDEANRNRMLREEPLNVDKHKGSPSICILLVCFEEDTNEANDEDDNKDKFSFVIDYTTDIESTKEMLQDMYKIQSIRIVLVYTLPSMIISRKVYNTFTYTIEKMGLWRKLLGYRFFSANRDEIKYLENRLNEATKDAWITSRTNYFYRSKVFEYMEEEIERCRGLERDSMRKDWEIGYLSESVNYHIDSRKEELDTYYQQQKDYRLREKDYIKKITLLNERVDSLEKKNKKFTVLQNKMEEVLRS